MRDQDKTKKQLIANLEAMRLKLAESEESDRRRKAGLELLSEIDRNWTEGGFTIICGTWMWDITADQVVFRFGTPPYASGELDPRFGGSWKEIVHPEHFDRVITQLDSLGRNPEHPMFVFPTRNGTWLAVMGPVTKDSADRGKFIISGIYFDFTPFHEVRTKINITTPDGSDVDLRGTLIHKISLIGTQELKRALIDETRQKIDENRQQMHKSEVKNLGFVTFALLEVMRHSNAPVFVIDRDLRYTYVSPAMTSLLGLPESELLGKTELEVFGAPCAILKEWSFEGGGRENTLRMGRLTTKTEVAIRDKQTFLVALKSVGIQPEETLGVLLDLRGGRTLESLEHGDQYRSKPMRDAMKLALTAAKSDAIVLLTGESGAGKDEMARYIHKHSDRSTGPYFSINCAAIQPELAESELFGHEQGAFTGARGRKRGLLELAEGGSLLLNEIGDLSLHLQGKLLTFLDTRQFTRVGGEKLVTVNARLIAATNKDLEKEVESGRFRSDLFWRINVCPITVPPVRERIEDIPILIEKLLSRIGKEMKKPQVPHLSQADVQKIMTYHWPGNVRELRNILERGMILSEGNQLKIDLPTVDGGSKSSQVEEPPQPQSGSEWKWSVGFPPGRTLEDLTKDMKRALLQEALNRAGGVKTAAARLLGITRDALNKQIKTLG